MTSLERCCVRAGQGKVPLARVVELRGKGGESFQNREVESGLEAFSDVSLGRCRLLA